MNRIGLNLAQAGPAKAERGRARPRGSFSTDDPGFLNNPKEPVTLLLQSLTFTLKPSKF